VERPKDERHKEQCNSIGDNAPFCENADAGVHRAAHESVADDFLLVQSLLEQGELLAEFIYFVLGDVAIVCLSFHNCMLFIINNKV
jgi:hypothetical protein